jgi:hypothetical protein
MRFLLLAAVLLLPAPQSNDQPYELKGEAPGMTMKEFRANHKHAECSRKSATVAKCEDRDGVSFAGVDAKTWRNCKLEECAFRGIFADFVDERLVCLRYSVSMGSAEKVIAALAKKYGEPSQTTKSSGSASSATWKNSVGYLTVMDIWVTGNHVLDSSTDITSGLNDAGESKDI